MDDIAPTQREIDNLLEGNTRDWHSLATKLMYPWQRRALRHSIKVRTEELNVLLRRKWKFEGKKKPLRN